MKQQHLSFWDIWNMSFGFLGIQFGYALQGGFMSRIFQTLGASKDELPLLWLAAPLTGLLVQPIIGYLSDRTWHHRWGRRRPYFMVGAILSSLALLFIPHSPYLWMAVGLLWILDTSINISMEPFRALVADKLPEAQRTYGFVVQALIIGVGTWIASSLPWLVSSLGLSDAASPGVIPLSVKVAFGIGAVVFLGSIFYTVMTTSETPPEDIDAFRANLKKQKRSAIGEIFDNIFNMPKTMLKLGVVQFFSWFAFFSMWSLANPALTEHVYKAPAPIKENFDFSETTSTADFQIQNEKFQKASNKVGANMGVYGLSSMVFALLLTFYASRKQVNRKLLHMASLTLGGLGFLMMYLVPDPKLLWLWFSLIGISWGSILSMPYAMLSSAIDPNKMGIMMGLFNMFIVIPQIFAALGGVNFLSNLLGAAPIYAMVVAGVSLLLSAFSNLLIKD
ncbi:MFS transporter [Flavobacteriaceae bacterium]|nr:MFS transporter [Flavobacteriaceae bacterium]MDC3238415.1 MFS transporter [Flavobacteriaceae bacterium]